MLPVHPAPDADNGYLAGHVQIILASYRRWFGLELVEPADVPEAMARRLFEAPFAVLSHGTEADPLLNYANRTALALFELDWQQLVAMPSRLTAEAPIREERRRLLETVARQGFIADYRGVRVSRTGQRFRIDDAKVWNLLDSGGAYAGQAALLPHWQPLAAEAAVAD